MTPYTLLKKRRLASNVCEYTVYAPLVARHCKAGQFVIVRVDEDGERVPFTICDSDKEEGSICLLVQEVGYTTLKMSMLKEGETLLDVVGPLGNPTDIKDYQNVCLIGGGIGSAVIYPQAKARKSEGRLADVILGARTDELLIYKDEFRACSANLMLVTDDGSSGKRGFVTDVLGELFAGGKRYDLVFAVGPLQMMKAVCALTKRFDVPTIVSMNSMMVDGTGMCGCCRLTVDGKIKYACVDGPEFDGHKVDFDEAIFRSRIYSAQEREHLCRLRGEK